jgi:hypothetical protein
VAANQPLEKEESTSREGDSQAAERTEVDPQPVAGGHCDGSHDPVIIPSTGADVSGTNDVLDATASSGVSKVQYEVTGVVDYVIATATPTVYG